MRVEVEGIKFDLCSLLVHKQGSWRSQTCPFNGKGIKQCGMWCPLCSDVRREPVGLNQTEVSITLCQDRTLYAIEREENDDEIHS